MLYNYETDEVEDEYLLDNNDISVEEGKAMEASFGQYIEPVLDWRPL